ncbi:MAG: ABC transporter substrate-binding protein [Spirochaetaceae bacterium]|jgi:NitT/TauT family transport system substrate-binding protein|nr:ABC transporter substrate-binding protein [Spirochaetaceae bacterium]
MKRFFGVLAMISVAALLLSVSACKKKDTAKVEGDYVFKVNFDVGYLCQAPLYIAVDQGYFEEEGLKWEKISTGDGNTMNLFTSGQIDGSIALMIGLIQPLANGLPVQVPLTVHTGCIKVLVRGDSDIQTVAGLKGKTIGGGGPAAPAILFTKRVLASNGFKVDGENAEFEYIYQSAAELPLLLERGVVDAIGLVDPAAQIAIDNNGFRAIIDNAVDEDYKDEYCCVIDVRAETVKSHPEATAKFLRAMQKGAKFVQEHPDETARIFVANEYVSIDPLLISKILKTYKWQASVSQARSALENNAKDLQSIGILNADVDVAKLVNDVYVVVPGVPDSLF